MPPARRVLVRSLVDWVVYALLWLLFVGATSWPELAAGAAAAAIATYATKVVELRKFAQVAPRLGPFAQAWRLPKYVVVGTWELAKVLARRLLGRPAASLVIATPYVANGDDDASATMRALATTYTTITPNFVVIDIDRRRGLLFFHQVSESDTPEMTLRLGATA